MKHRRAGKHLLRVHRLAPVIGLVGCAGLVWQSSHGTFTASTANGLNQLAAGSVVITDNDANVAAKPSASDVRSCSPRIVVASRGDPTDCAISPARAGPFLIMSCRRVAAPIASANSLTDVSRPVQTFST